MPRCLYLPSPCVFGLNVPFKNEGATFAVWVWPPHADEQTPADFSCGQPHLNSDKLGSRLAKKYTDFPLPFI